MKYKNHPSILSIQAKCKGKNKFSFTEVTTQDIKKEIFDLETRKASQISDTPTLALLNLLCFRLVLNF